jgi:hypothetical protein
MGDEAQNPNAETSAEGTPVTGDQNVKAEFNRKLSNLQDEMKKNNELLLAQIGQLVKPKAPEVTATQKAPIKDRFYGNEDQVLGEVVEEAVTRAVDTVKKDFRQDGERQRALNQVFSEYPELSDETSELYVQSNKIFDSLTEQERRDPKALKFAVREAAADLGLVPKQKRPNMGGQDDYVGNGGRPNQPGNRRDKDALPNETLDFAEALGRPVNDKAYQERLKKHAKRNFGKWKGLKDQ